MKEIWKIMKENNKYEISNFGKIKTIKTQKIRKPIISKKGYYQMIFYINKKPKSYFVHRLVANNFIDNPNNYEQINHKNENKLDNRVENLEWCNNKYNANYGTKTERMLKTKWNTFRKIIQKDKNNNVIKLWENIIEIQKETKYNKANIYKCCEGKYKYAYNYIWEYTTL